MEMRSHDQDGGWDTEEEPSRMWSWAKVCIAAIVVCVMWLVDKTVMPVFARRGNRPVRH